MKELEAGQKVRIKFDLSSLRSESLMCVIKWFEEDRVALVFPDSHKHLARSLPEGKELEAVIYTDSGIFSFESIVINSPLEHDFIIEIPDEKKRIQRRDYIRAPFNLRLILSKGNEEIETKTINIGGGGIRFLVRDELKSNDFWDFILYMPDEAPVKGKGTIIYSLSQGKLIATVIKFTDINETDRNKIIKKCFEEEVKNIKSKKQTTE